MFFYCRTALQNSVPIVVGRRVKKLTKKKKNDPHPSPHHPVPFFAAN